MANTCTQFASDFPLLHWLSFNDQADADAATAERLDSPDGRLFENDVGEALIVPHQNGRVLDDLCRMVDFGRIRNVDVEDGA